MLKITYYTGVNDEKETAVVHGDIWLVHENGVDYIPIHPAVMVAAKYVEKIEFVEEARKEVK